MSRLLPLFLVCFVSIAYEIALTRYFALSSWSEYGYWIISIAMVGLAASGTVAALAARPLLRHAEPLLALLPAALIVAATLGWHATTLVPFNPLELQNRELWGQQFANIARCYAALFPFFFLVGLYVSLVFMGNAERIGRVYAADLAGAGLGAAAVLLLMLAVPPFQLVAWLLPPLAVAALLEAWGRRRRAAGLAAVAVFVPCLASLVLFNQARVNEFKDVFAPLNTAGSTVLAEVRSPKGQYLLVDSFVERLDADLSNNAGRLGVRGLPAAFGLYLDGNRIAGLPRAPRPDTTYFAATLDSLPYRLRPGARVLLLGAGGGFRLHEARAAGATAVEAIEPDPVLRRALVSGLGPVAPLLGAEAPAAERQRLDTSPLALAALRRDAPFDLIDVTREFLAQSDTNRAVLAVETLAGLLGLLAPDGLLAVPISIREFPVYAVQGLVTATAALRAAGIADPARHLVAYRSAFTVKLLLSPTPFAPAALEAIRRFCDERSFDVVHLAGRDLAGLRVYNQLQLVGFDAAANDAAAGPDPLRAEATAALAGSASPYHGFFRLRPPTLDRPFFTGVLPLDRLGTILERVELVPREELAWLVNLAVLAQALVLGLAVALLPLLARRSFAGVAAGRFAGVLAYFGSLGVGFLALEIYLIEKAAHYLQDRTLAFGLVLAALLVAAGAGSWLAQRPGGAPARDLRRAVLGIGAWIALAWLGLDALLQGTAGGPLALRVAVLLAVVVPLGLALGLPMALGLGRLAGTDVALLPWAWAINGAGSVIATPLASLVMAEAGYPALLAAALAFYLVAGASLPGGTRIHSRMGFGLSPR
ncbi:MAG: hypothetical protein U1E23_02130 [Reyranellaceae bacterium]